LQKAYDLLLTQETLWRRLYFCYGTRKPCVRPWLADHLLDCRLAMLSQVH
jgi:hypothetical protein